MSESAIQIVAKPNEPAPPVLPAVTPTAVRQLQHNPWYWPRRALLVAASLRNTVVLFFLAILLIFFGTLAQVDAGIWTVVSKYFRCFFTWIPLKIFFPRDGRVVPGGFPFPGGWLIAGLLLVNLLAAHAIRFRMTWKRSGIMILHAGLIIMIVGEFVTGLFAVESRMMIVTGRSTNYVFSLDAVELVFVTPNDNDTEHVIAVPGGMLKKEKTIENDLLPFDIFIVRWLPNAEIKPGENSKTDNPANTGIGKHRVAVEHAEQNGADSEGKVDMPAAYVSFRDRATGASLGTYLFSTSWSMGAGDPQKVNAGGKTYEVELRFKRTYKPYSVHLNEIRTELYPLTETPKSFTSRIQLLDPRYSVDREITITMNEPLRYEGDTFYQAGAPDANITTILQVVRNPGWMLPYISCFTVGLGMLIHFGIQLVEFLRRRNFA
jgi:hypothetical protein